MPLHKRLSLSLCLGLSVVAAAAADTHAIDKTGPAVPVIGDTHRQFLSRVARRTLRDAVLDREAYAPSYVPKTLEDLSAEVIVRLWQSGFLLADAAAGPAPITKAVSHAARTALAGYRATDTVDLDQVNALLVEIEVIGPAEPIPVTTDWTTPRAVDPFVEPGVHGLVLRGPGQQRRLSPTELLMSDQTLADALQKVAKAMLTSATSVEDVELQRFRTVHWVQPGRRDEVVSLQRGLTVVPRAAVTRASIDETIARIAEYMAYRQLPSGLFTYQYEPGADRYAESNNLVRQVGATEAMAVHARWSRRSASTASADLAIRYHLRGLTQIPGVDDAAFIATADDSNKLGVTALLALALGEHPQPQQYAATRKKLINGMLWLQRPSGLFLTAFPPSLDVGAQDYFPGEALLALATEYDHDPSPRILDAFDRAVSFYRKFFQAAPSPAFVPWQVQAYALMARHTKRADYAAYVFELTDWLADRQLSASNCPWPDLWGGIAAYAEGRAGVATAAYLEGFADALRLARTVGDVDRASRYERVVRAAVRFVMQLQVRPEEVYFSRSPQDAVGGIRTGPALNLLRIDHCQHALVGLIKARRALFPEG